MEMWDSVHVTQGCEWGLDPHLYRFPGEPHLLALQAPRVWVVPKSWTLFLTGH